MPPSRSNKRRKRIEQQTRPSVDLRKPMMASVLAGAALTGLYLLALALDRPIVTVDVEGPFQRVPPPQVEAAVARYLQGGFLSADLRSLRAGLEAIAWVDRVVVQRQWPNGLRVSVTEQHAAARWGRSGLLNTRGELFIETARHVPPELPQLSGPDGSEWQVAQRYLGLRAQLLVVGFDLAAVSLDARGAWGLTLANGVEVRLGRESVDERLQRFVGVVMPSLAQRLGSIEYVDMRYSNGFAIGWINPVDHRFASEEREPNA